MRIAFKQDKGKKPLTQTAVTVSLRAQIFPELEGTTTFSESLLRHLSKLSWAGLALLFFFTSCSPHNALFGTEAELQAASPLVQGWSEQVFWRNAVIEKLPVGLVAQTIDAILHDPHNVLKTAVLLFAPDPQDLEKWQKMHPELHWAWLDLSGSAANIPHTLRLTLNRDQGWQALAEAAGKLARKKKITSAEALILADTSLARRSALLRGWKKFQKNSPLDFIEVPLNETDPTAVMKLIPAATRCLFLLYGPSAADLTPLLDPHVLRFGVFIPVNDLDGWSATEIPDGQSAYAQIQKLLPSMSAETLSLPWKTVYSAR
jgi:hypothetical protein